MRWTTTDGLTYTDTVTGAVVARGPTDERRWVVMKYATGGIGRGVGFALRDHAEEHACGMRDAPSARRGARPVRR